MAIANEGGGYLLCGISNLPPRPVVGTGAFNSPQQMGVKLLNALGFRGDRISKAIEAFKVQQNSGQTAEA